MLQEIANFIAVTFVVVSLLAAGIWVEGRERGRMAFRVVTPVTWLIITLAGVTALFARICWHAFELADYLTRVTHTPTLLLIGAPVPAIVAYALTVAVVRWRRKRSDKFGIFTDEVVNKIILGASVVEFRGKCYAVQSDCLVGPPFSAQGMHVNDRHGYLDHTMSFACQIPFPRYLVKRMESGLAKRHVSRVS